ncbi:MAG TPA: ATP-binding protein, partial [Solirubrobacteraceae bacterium]
SPGKVTGSEPLLRRMVDNVIDNAVRHNKPHGSITITCHTDGERARLVVDSGGPPLDPPAVAELARPFKRLGADRTGSQDGHGLGLSIVAAIAAAHSGDLELAARPQGGLRAHISLPTTTATNAVTSA